MDELRRLIDSWRSSSDALFAAAKVRLEQEDVNAIEDHSRLAAVAATYLQCARELERVDVLADEVA
jgi:hypothetical protein